MRRSPRSRAVLALAAIAAIGGVGACNQISGVDELVFDRDPNAEGGFGGALHGTGGPAGTGGLAGGGGDGGSTSACGGPCDQPPSDCFDSQGSCVDGQCVYTPLAEGSACSDGDPCTEGDVCGAFGECVPGPECPNADPCLDVTCQPSGCVEAAKPDGSSCGPLAADRCCGGACVDVSSDPAHCGGCGYGCAGGESCESVAVTNQCSSNPPDTTGRCTCSSNSRCPFGQICRNQNPHPWRCTPSGPADCPGTTFVDLSLCPNYCVY